MKLIKRIQAWLLIPLLFPAVYSCIKDDGGLTVPGDGESEITFSIRVPGKGGQSTRALEYNGTEENHVETVDVLVFNSERDELLYIRQASNIGDNGGLSEKTFTVRLIPGTVKLVVLANCRDEIEAAGLSSGMKRDAVEKNIKQQNIGRWNTAANTFRPFAMYGEIPEVEILPDRELNDGKAITLVRMVARVDVAVHEDAAGDFLLQELYVYNFHETGQVMPSNSNWDAVKNIVTAPSIPVAANGEVPPTTGPQEYLEYKDPSRSAEIFGEAYIYESRAGSRKDYLDNICIVVGGLYKGGEYYYRIDFIDKEKGTEEYLAILRNHRYLVEIASVDGPGYDTKDEAFKSLPFNIKVNIALWDEYDIEDVIYGAQYYLGVSPRKSEFGMDGGELALAVSTDYPEWSFKISYTEESDKDWIVPEGFSEGTLYKSEDYKTLPVAVTPYADDKTREGYIDVTAGTLTMRAVIGQSDWTLANVKVEPTGIIPKGGEIRQVVATGNFKELEVRAWDLTNDELIDENVIDETVQGERKAGLHIPMFLEEMRTVAFEYYLPQESLWKIIRTDDQPGYVFTVKSSHTDGQEINPSGEFFDVTVTGDWPEVYVRAAVNSETVGYISEFTAGTGEETLKLEVSPNGTSTRRDVDLQWSVDMVRWRPISSGGQDPAKFRVGIDHTDGDYVPARGRSYHFDVEGEWPELMFRAAVSGQQIGKTETLAAGQGSGVEVALAVGSNETDNPRPIRFQWSEDGGVTWFTVSSGDQRSYDFTVTTNYEGGDIPDIGAKFRFTVEGIWPTVYIGYNEGTLGQIIVIGADGPSMSNEMTVYPNPLPTPRTINFQWKRYYDSSWTTIASATQEGSVVERYVVTLGPITGDIPAAGGKYNFNVTGEWTDLRFRASSENVGLPGAAASLSAGAGTDRKVEITVPENNLPDSRPIDFQYSQDGGSSWTTIATATQL